MRQKLQTLLKTSLPFLLGICFFSSVQAQTVIAASYFNGVSGTFSSTNNLSYVGGNSSSGQRPASLPFFSEGTQAGECTNTQTILSTGNINTTNYCNNKLSFRLAAWSLNSSNGLDDGDAVIVEISTNGGSSYNDLLEVTGKSNATWHYSTGTGIASVPFSGASSPTVFTPSGGGSRTSDGYSTVEITNLPSTSQLRVRITMDCGDNERWTIDDFKITGTAAGTTPTIGISTSSTSVCSGASTTFTSTIGNAGSTPSYQWRINGTNVSGANASTFTTTTLTNGAVVSCIVTSSEACNPSSTSGNITMTVNANVTPTVSISVNPNNVCAGTTQNFSSSFTNGGSVQSYQWTRNGSNISGASSSTYSSSSLSNGDVIGLVLTSNATCRTSNTATASTITAQINANVTPTVSISVNTNNVCAGTTQNFTSSITNGGASPAYQWTRNGSNISGANASTYSSSTLSNGDVIGLVLTSNATCKTSTTATASTITAQINANVTPTVSISVNNNVCAGTTQNFSSSITNGGASPAYQWTRNGSNISGASSSTYSSSSLSNGDVIGLVLTSNATCKTSTTATASTITMTINANVTPSVSITASQNNVCSGSNITFNATPSNGGSNPQYAWFINGSAVSGQTNNSFSTTALNNNDVVVCSLTSNATCRTSNSVASNSITAQINANVTPTVSISVNNNNVCAGTAQNFTSSITNGGASPAYQWTRNGSNISGASSSTYSSSTLSNGDVIGLVLTSNATCRTSNTATASTITAQINANVTPTVSISVNNNVCAGTTQNFSSSITNGGASPAYQWTLNGSNISGSNSASFSSSALANGDIIGLVMTSNANCRTSNTATASTITAQINANVTPTVSISVNSNNVCAGTTQNFTSSITNGGASPAYQWTRNGSNISGATASTYSSSSLSNGDVIGLVMTSNANCRTANTATASTITAQINANVTPTVSISVNNNVCAGTTQNFTSSITNGGASPAYQWTRNGSNISGATASTYSSSSLANGDVIGLVMTSNATCLTSNTATASTITAQINANVTPAVSISVNNNVCAGTTQNFTSSITNGGASPAYQWTRNGSNISGASSSTYSSSSLSNGDVIGLVLTSNANCRTANTATASTITAQINANVTPTVSISVNTNNVCAGTAQNFTSSITNGGASPAYQWTRNGSNISGATASTYSSSSLSNGDVIGLVLTSNANCRTANTATASTITTQINANVTPTVSISVNSNNVCAGTTQNFTSSITNGGASPAYQWTRNGSNISGASSSTYSSSSLSNGDVIGLVLTSNATCKTSTTATASTITMTINANVTPSVSITASQNNVCSGSNITFNATPSNGGSNPQYAWFINGSAVSGQTNNSFSTTALNNNDVVVCSLTSNATCRTSNSVVSNSITAQINANVTPTVSFSVNTNNICPGTAQSFTSSITNGGASPSYQWTRNGSNISGAFFATYASSGLANGDVIGLVLTSNATCRTSNTASASTITMQVKSRTTATASISTSNSSICPNTSVTFNSSITNGGSNPTYSWRVNGITVGTNSSTLVADTFTAAKTISLELTPSADACPNFANTNSNSLNVSILSGINNLTASSTSPQICRGTSVQLNASASTTARFDTAFIHGFESSQSAWTLINGSTGGTSSSRTGSSFTYRVSPYNYSGNDHISNDNSRFVFANSENHNGATNVSIISPSFSTAGFSSATLNFFHYYNENGTSIANVSISTNGTSWTSLQSYTSDIGSRTNFSSATLSIPAGFLNQSTVFVRFNFVTTGAERYWAIDNVLVSGTKNHAPTFSWDDQNNSNVGNQASVSNYSPNQTANLTLTATNIYGCSSTQTVAVQVDQPTQSGQVSGDQLVCRGINAGVLQITNQTGAVQKWQWSTNGNVWNDVTNTTNTLSFSNLTTQRQFRAEVKNGVCSSNFTPNFPVNVKNKNWTGDFDNNWFDARNWCGGIPDSTEDVDIDLASRKNPVFNGNVTVRSLNIQDTLFVGSYRFRVLGDITGNGKLKTTSQSVIEIAGNGNQVEFDFVDPINSLSSVSVNRASGLKLNKSVRIHNSLELNNGKVDLANESAYFEKNAVLNGGNSNAYLRTNGTGQVSKDFNSNESFTFKIGNASYNPTTVKNNDGGIMGARVEDQITTSCSGGNTITQESVNRTWHITKSSPNVNGVDLTFEWTGTDELNLFNRNLCYASHCNSANNTWEKLSSGSKSATGTGPFSISYTNYMGTFSPFGVGSGNGALPVTWVQVAAKKVNESTMVTWSTASEKGTDRFEIERSLDGKKFEKIGQVAAVGNSNTLQNYSFRDAQNILATTFYRIKSVDFDGTTEYSKTVSVQFNALHVSTFPNPTTGKVNLQGVDKAEIEIVNALGKVMNKFSFNGNSNSEIDLSNLPDGIYFISITQNQTTQQIRVVKSNP